MKISRPVLAHEEITSEGGMVAAQHPLGVQAGLEVLQKGGNAVDAAITTAFAMGVLQPLMNGIGGGGLMVVHLDGGGGGAVDYGMQAPGAAHADMFELQDEYEPPGGSTARHSRRFSYRAVKGRRNVQGHTSISIPGTVAGLCAALEKWGTVGLDQALAPAIEMAADGFAVGHHFTLALVERRDLFLSHPATAAIYYPDGYPIPAGELLVQAEHADTLRKIASGGPDAFYRGDVAQLICDDVQQNGGYLRPEDFAQYQPLVHDSPLAGSYRGMDISAVQGPCAGPTLLEILNILECADIGSLKYGSADALHMLIEATKLAAVDRFTYMGDPALTGAPLGVLAEKRYAATRSSHLDMERAGEPGPGDPWQFTESGRPSGFPAPAGVNPDRGTTHLSVVDRHRNAVALTQTNYSFSGVVNPGVGVMMNNAMGWSCPMPGTVNSLAPYARALNNMTPVVLHSGGRLHAALGASGGRRIWTAVMQSIVHHIDFGMSLQESVQAPRMHVESDDVVLDGRFGNAVRDELVRRSHHVEIVTPHYTASPYAEPNGILVDGDVLRSAVYPVAKPTVAAGY